MKSSPKGSLENPLTHGTRPFIDCIQIVSCVTGVIYPLPYLHCMQSTSDAATEAIQLLNVMPAGVSLFD